MSVSMVLTLLIGAVAAATGWFLGARSAERRIDARFAELERRLLPTAAAPPEPSPPASAPTPAPEPPPADLIPVLAAAVCAYLGKPVRIRRVRTAVPALAHNPWGHQGRVSVQGSHNLRAFRR